jgi:hypothetical protein
MENIESENSPANAAKGFSCATVSEQTGLQHGNSNTKKRQVDSEATQESDSKRALEDKGVFGSCIFPCSIVRYFLKIDVV